MLEEEYKRAFEHIAPSRQLVERTERSVEAMINGKKVKKITLRAALVTAILTLALAAIAVAAVYGGIMSLFRFEGIPGNEAVVEQVEPIVKPAGDCYEGPYVRLQMRELMLTENMLAASWTVANLTDQRLYVGSPCDFKLNCGQLGPGKGENIENYYLEPNQTLSCAARFFIPPEGPAKIYRDDVVRPISDTGNLLQLGLSVYRVPEDWDDRGEPELNVFEVKGDADALGSLPSPFGDLEGDGQSGLWARVDTPKLALRLDRSPMRTWQAPPQSFAFDLFTLEVLRAELSATGARFSWRMVFDSKEAALSRPQANFDGDSWYYRVDAADGDWAESGGGKSPGEPIQLEDGRWAWTMDYTFSGLYRLPTRFAFSYMYCPAQGGAREVPGYRAEISLD